MLVYESTGAGTGTGTGRNHFFAYSYHDSYTLRVSFRILYPVRILCILCVSCASLCIRARIHSIHCILMNLLSPA